MIILRVVSIFILNCIRKVSETTTESDRELTKDLEMRLAETAPRILPPKVLATQSFCLVGYSFRRHAPPTNEQTSVSSLNSKLVT